MAGVREQAKCVVRHCCFVPEVHDHGEVLRVGSGSNDEEPLVLVVIEGAIVLVWVAISSPKDVSTVLGVEVVTAVASEDRVPSAAGE